MTPIQQYIINGRLYIGFAAHGRTYIRPLVDGTFYFRGKKHHSPIHSQQLIRVPSLQDAYINLEGTPA